MEYTDIYNIPCLGEEDYAAVALHMQNLALTIEAKLDEQQTAFEDFQATGSLIWTQTLSNTIVVSAVPGLPDVEPRLTWPAAPSGVHGLDYVADQEAIPPLRGWFYIGAFVRLGRVGVATGPRALSVRVGTVGYDFFYGNAPLPGNTEVAQFRSLINTSDTEDFDDLWVSGSVYNDGTSYLQLAVSIYNGDTVSLTTELSCPAKLWLHYMGDSTDIRQVL